MESTSPQLVMSQATRHIVRTTSFGDQLAAELMWQSVFLSWQAVMVGIHCQCSKGVQHTTCQLRSEWQQTTASTCLPQRSIRACFSLVLNFWYDYCWRGIDVVAKNLSPKDRIWKMKKKHNDAIYNRPFVYNIYNWIHDLCIYIECVCWSISFGFQTESRFYWWTPDDSFIQLKPTQVLFPPNNAYEWSQSIYTTGAVAVPVVKLNSYDISSMSPTLAKLVLNSELDLDAVNSMMLDKVQNSLTREQAACAWLKSNEDRWKATRLSRAQCRILELQTQVCYSLLVTRCYSDHNASPRRSPSWVSQCVSSTASRNCMHYWQ